MPAHNWTLNHFIWGFKLRQTLEKLWNMCGASPRLLVVFYTEPRLNCSVTAGECEACWFQQSVFEFWHPHDPWPRALSSCSVSPIKAQTEKRNTHIRFNFRQENTNFPAYTNTELVYSSLLNSELVSSESRNRRCWWEIECLCVSSGLWGKTCWASSDLKLSVWSDCASRIVGLSYVTAPTLKCLHWD